MKTVNRTTLKSQLLALLLLLGLSAAYAQSVHAVCSGYVFSSEIQAGQYGGYVDVSMGQQYVDLKWPNQILPPPFDANPNDGYPGPVHITVAAYQFVWFFGPAQGNTFCVYVGDTPWYYSSANPNGINNPNNANPGSSHALWSDVIDAYERGDFWDWSSCTNHFSSSNAALNDVYANLCAEFYYGGPYYNGQTVISPEPPVAFEDMPSDDQVQHLLNQVFKSDCSNGYPVLTDIRHLINAYQEWQELRDIVANDPSQGYYLADQIEALEKDMDLFNGPASSDIQALLGSTLSNVDVTAWTEEASEMVYAADELDRMMYYLTETSQWSNPLPFSQSGNTDWAFWNHLQDITPDKDEFVSGLFFLELELAAVNGSSGVVTVPSYVWNPSYDLTQHLDKVAGVLLAIQKACYFKDHIQDNIDELNLALGQAEDINNLYDNYQQWLMEQTPAITTPDHIPDPLIMVSNGPKEPDLVLGHDPRSMYRQVDILGPNFSYLYSIRNDNGSDYAIVQYITDTDGLGLCSSSNLCLDADYEFDNQLHEDIRTGKARWVTRNGKFSGKKDSDIPFEGLSDTEMKQFVMKVWQLAVPNDLDNFFTLDNIQLANEYDTYMFTVQSYRRYPLNARLLIESPASPGGVIPSLNENIIILDQFPSDRVLLTINKKIVNQGAFKPFLTVADIAKSLYHESYHVRQYQAALDILGQSFAIESPPSLSLTEVNKLDSEYIEIGAYYHQLSTAPDSMPLIGPISENYRDQLENPKRAVLASVGFWPPPKKPEVLPTIPITVWTDLYTGIFVDDFGQELIGIDSVKSKSSSFIIMQGRYFPPY